MSEKLNNYKKQKRRLSRKINKTSSGNIYIHLDPTDNDINDRALIAFQSSKIKQQLSPQIQKLENSVKKNFKVPNNYKDIIKFLDHVKGDFQSALTESDIGKEIKTTGARGNFKASIFDKETEKMIIRDVETSFANLMNFNNSKEKSSLSVSDMFNKVDGIMTNLNSYLEFVDEIIEGTKLEFADEKIQTWIESYLLANRGVNPASGSAFSEAYESFLKENNGRLISKGNGEFRKAEKTFETYAIRLKTYQLLTKRLSESIGLGGKGISYDKRLLQGVAYLTGRTINSLGGYMYEPLVSDMVNQATNALMGTISSSVAGSDSVKIEGPEIRRAMGMTFTKSKPDIHLSYKEGEGANISLDLPGASIKAFTPNPTYSHQKIRARTGATINEIYSLSLNRQREKQYLLANVLSYKGTKGMSPGLKTMATNFLGSAHAIYALAGTLQKNDTAYYMILNRKIMSISDVINSIVSEESYIKSTISAMSTFQNLNKPVKQKKDESIDDAATRRSDAVLKAYLSSKVNIDLMLSNNLL